MRRISPSAVTHRRELPDAIASRAAYVADMNETGLSAIDLRLTKAQELIARGKQRRATQELWNAEALARGNEDAIRKLLDFTTAFEQQVEPRLKPRLADLVVALEHYAGSASRSRVAPQALPTGRLGLKSAALHFLSFVTALGAMATSLVMIDHSSCTASGTGFWSLPAAMWILSIALVTGAVFSLTFRSSARGRVGSLLVGLLAGVFAGGVWGFVGLIAGIGIALNSCPIGF
jgi:hypothetical protein